MRDQEFRGVAQTQEQAHTCALRAYAHAKALLANGDRVLITAAPLLEPIGVKQRGFLHGPVFTQISEQVRVQGERYVTAIWKEFYRKMFLPDTWEQRRMPGAKRATPHRVRHSTEELGIKGYSEHIDKVIAHAVTEWGVQFVFDGDERDGVRYLPPARKANLKLENCSN